ncbi:unnamed protein product [Effrenium voratum]|nr:unnamed protein product [Effrenium voratum]
MAPVLQAPVQALGRGPSASEAWIAGSLGLLPALFVVACLARYARCSGCLETLQVSLLLAAVLSFPVTCFYAGAEGAQVCGLPSGMLEQLSCSSDMLSAGMSNSVLVLQTHFAVMALLFSWWSARPLWTDLDQRHVLLCTD